MVLWPDIRWAAATGSKTPKTTTLIAKENGSSAIKTVDRTHPGHISPCTYARVVQRSRGPTTYARPRKSTYLHCVRRVRVKFKGCSFREFRERLVPADFRRPGLTAFGERTRWWHTDENRLTSSIRNGLTRALLVFHICET